MFLKSLCRPECIVGENPIKNSLHTGHLNIKISEYFFIEIDSFKTNKCVVTLQ